jgi:hypothetical protein
MVMGTQYCTYLTTIPVSTYTRDIEDNFREDKPKKMGEGHGQLALPVRVYSAKTNASPAIYSTVYGIFSSLILGFNTGYSEEPVCDAAGPPSVQTLGNAI